MFNAVWCSGFSGAATGATLNCVGAEVVADGVGGALSLTAVDVDGATGCGDGAGVEVDELCFAFQP